MADERLAGDSLPPDVAQDEHRQIMEAVRAGTMTEAEAVAKLEALGATHPAAIGTYQRRLGQLAGASLVPGEDDVWQQN